MAWKTLSAVVFSIVAATPAAAQDQPAGRPIVGELRVLSVSTGPAVDRLHQAGWLEARGQVVSRAAFPELFDTIGRSWTAESVASDSFTIPLVTPGSMRMIAGADNPYGVLGPGDMVRSGLPRPNRQGPLSCWIYVGRPVGGAVSATAVKHPTQ
jgi:hypothetical protein